MNQPDQNPLKPDKYDDMYQDIANNISIMNAMEAYQQITASRRYTIEVIINELRRMGYTRPPSP